MEVERDPDTGEINIKSLSYEKTNHVIIIKTHGRRSIQKTFRLLGYGLHTPNKFSALTLKHVNPRATAIVFSTGNITIMGCDSWWAALYVLQVLKEKLALEIIDIKMTNVVFKFNRTTGIDHVEDTDVQELYKWDKSRCECDMDLFPACVYQVPSTRIKANFFDKGMVVVIGCSNDDKLRQVLAHLVEVIQRFINRDDSIKIDGKNLVVM